MIFRLNRATFLLALCGSLAILAGCSGSHAKVSGLVTLDGAPLKSGGVSFHPAAGDGVVAVGQIDASGNYSLNSGTTAGVKPGKYLVTVVATEPVPPQEPGQTPAPPPLITPAKYGNVSTTDQTVEVKAGRNDIPLKLVTP